MNDTQETEARVIENSNRVGVVKGADPRQNGKENSRENVTLVQELHVRQLGSGEIFIWLLYLSFYEGAWLSTP